MNQRERQIESGISNKKETSWAKSNIFISPNKI